MKIHFVYSSNAKSREAYRHMVKIYGQVPLDKADCIVVLSGDGMVLRAFHESFQYNLPVYGMNRGKLGFLTNEYSKENLIERIQDAASLKFNPLQTTVVTKSNGAFSSIAVNEVYLLRETHQSAKLSITVDGDLKLKELVCDGLIIASDIGSTAYNYSAGGAIIPINSGLLALTPISSFRPRRWRGAVLSDYSKIEIQAIDQERRPVCAVADYVEFRGATKVCVSKNRSMTLTLLLDKDNTLENKVLAEQFAT